MNAAAVIVQHIRHRNAPQPPHFSSSGFLYKHNPAIHGEGPPPTTFCGDAITIYDLAWKERAWRRDLKKCVGFAVCGDCALIANGERAA